MRTKIVVKVKSCRPANISSSACDTPRGSGANIRLNKEDISNPPVGSARPLVVRPGHTELHNTQIHGSIDACDENDLFLSSLQGWKDPAPKAARQLLRPVLLFREKPGGSTIGAMFANYRRSTLH